MAMTVRALIAKLKKMPPNAWVAWQNHDQSSWEIDGYVNSVREADESLYTAEQRTELRDDPRRKVVILNS
jgi:hypothetical protein